ncbi:YbaB/EbfC family nucleoid-associated protein [Streptacidiphilus griseoplanus]|uniref:YbaB/EbfC family nucleoid-associated protein n=1 Tax=Peterkaempfera griseoplana TaxID=66896 RepID=UPI0007C641BE|nr:YbaB/EbfC family nucleoid-associated protein [Peterkaempfera griseoplana]
MDTNDGLGIQRLLHSAARLQQDLVRAQEELGAATVQGTAGGGAVRATVNGRGELQDVVISPAVADPGNTPGLADLIVSAVRDAQRAVVARSEERFVPVLEALNTELRDFSG